MFITCSFPICQHVPWTCDHNQGLHANKCYSKPSVQTITGCDIHLHDLSYSHYSSSNVRVRQHPQNGGLWMNLFSWHLAPKHWVPAACLQEALKASTDKQCLLLKWCPFYASAGNLSRNLRRNQTSNVAWRAPPELHNCRVESARSYCDWPVQHCRCLL